MIAGQLIYDNQLIVQFHCCLYDWLLSSSCQTWFLTCCKLAPYMTSNPLWLMYMRLRNLGMIASAVDLDCTLPENNAFFFARFEVRLYLHYDGIILLSTKRWHPRHLPFFRVEKATTSSVICTRHFTWMNLPMVKILCTNDNINATQ